MLSSKKDTDVKLSREESSIYSKQIILEQIGLEGQKKIKKSKILVIGAGGLGCAALTYLALSGVGYIGIIDEDYIESSNLNRQVLYSINDLKKSKVLSAKDKLIELNRQCTIITHKYHLNKYNKVEIISNYDVVVDTTDNFNTRHLIDETCYRLHKAYVYGAVREFEGQIGVFNYKSGIRYRDIYGKTLNNPENNCNERGTMGITTGYIGTLQAIETLKIVLGLSKTCKNFIHTHNIIQMISKYHFIRLKRDFKNAHTYVRVRNSKINKLTEEKLNDHYRKIRLIIDVREEENFIREHLNKSINIPLIKFRMKKTITLMKKYEKISNVMLYCNNFDRTVVVSRILERNRIQHSTMSK